MGDSHIEARRSFAFENALRTDTRFQQIRRAKEMGFRVLMDYLAAGSVEEHIRRGSPAWLETALEHSSFEIDHLRGVVRGRSR